MHGTPNAHRHLTPAPTQHRLMCPPVCLTLTPSSAGAAPGVPPPAWPAHSGAPGGGGGAGGATLYACTGWVSGPQAWEGERHGRERAGGGEGCVHGGRAGHGHGRGHGRAQRGGQGAHITPGHTCPCHCCKARSARLIPHCCCEFSELHALVFTCAHLPLCWGPYHSSLILTTSNPPSSPWQPSPIPMRPHPSICTRPSRPRPGRPLPRQPIYIYAPPSSAAGIPRKTPQRA